MATDRIPGPIGRTPPAGGTGSGSSFPSGGGSFAQPGPVSADGDDAEQLDDQKRITKVVRDWTNPPKIDEQAVDVSGATLAAVKAELDKLTEWGSGGGTMNGLRAEPNDDGKGYTVKLSPTFTMSLPDWKEYPQASDAAKKAWDDMIENLRMHELEHVAIARRNFEKLATTLGGKPVAQAAQAVADAETAGQADQDDFDSEAKTAHGRNAWQTFPKVVLDTNVK